jgi:hypothetical protein
MGRILRRILRQTVRMVGNAIFQGWRHVGEGGVGGSWTRRITRYQWFQTSDERKKIQVYSLSPSHL